MLELQLQHQSFQWIFRVDFLKDRLVWFPCRPRDSQESFLALQFKSINNSVLSPLYGPTLIAIFDCWKSHSFDYILTSFSKVMSLLFNVLSRFVIAFLPRRKHLLILWLQSPPAVILELKKIKSATVSTFPPSFCHEVIWSHISVINVSDKLQWY